MSTHKMFSWRNKKKISIFQMKKVPYLLLCCFLRKIRKISSVCHLLNFFAQRVVKVKVLSKTVADDIVILLNLFFFFF